MSEENQVNEAATPELQLGDLAAVVRIVDICAKRGAFEGSELETVGAVRGRLAAFVQANAPQQEESEEAEEEATEE